ncbi:MAG: MobA/MobL family protein, partial [Erysipelotrichaceae bacterium]
TGSCVTYHNYITSHEKQEKLLFTSSNVPAQYWKDLERESEKTHARGLNIAIPNEYKGEANRERLERFVNDFVESFHVKNGCDYVVAVHDNETNLHMHIMFSERTLLHPDNVPKLKEKTIRERFKVEGKYVSKAKYLEVVSEGRMDVEHIPKKKIIELVDKKFSKKDDKYKSKEWYENIKNEYTQFINDRKLDHEAEWSRTIKEGHVAEIHVGKANPKNNRVTQERMDFNKSAQEHNRIFDELEAKGHDMSVGVEAVLKSIQDHTTSLINAITEEIANFKRRLEERSKSVDKVDNEVQSISDQLVGTSPKECSQAEIKEKLDNQQQELDNQQQELEECELELDTLNKEVAAKRVECKKLKSKIDENKAQIKRIESKTGLKAVFNNETTDSYISNNKELKRTLDEVIAKGKELVSTINILTAKINDLKTEIDKCLKLLQPLSEKTAKDPKKSLIKSLEDNKKKVADKDINIKGKSYTRNTR